VVHTERSGRRKVTAFRRETYSLSAVPCDAGDAVSGGYQFPSDANHHPGWGGDACAGGEGGTVSGGYQFPSEANHHPGCGGGGSGGGVVGGAREGDCPLFSAICHSVRPAGGWREAPIGAEDAVGNGSICC